MTISLCNIFIFNFQTLMNAHQVTTNATVSMQLVVTLQEVTNVLVNLGILEMDVHVPVSEGE